MPQHPPVVTTLLSMVRKALFLALTGNFKNAFYLQLRPLLVLVATLRGFGVLHQLYELLVGIGVRFEWGEVAMKLGVMLIHLTDCCLCLLLGLPPGCLLLLLTLRA